MLLMRFANAWNAELNPIHGFFGFEYIRGAIRRMVMVTVQVDCLMVMQLEECRMMTMSVIRALSNDKEDG
ncbi:hypothetical protein V6N12_066071 [Hibiscus sabdariffa]|uniref:Uncharacterized protein n=1 Tax=Hibiscus sabdariffa TaxID=183260 RepID=A0ABR2ATQ8_9ROSI